MAGIVGRTGAGKTSIIQAIFRIIEPGLGSQYRIDKYDALEMGLHSLRQHVSVIPQTPFLFKGSVKQNLDPFSTASDDQIQRNGITLSGAQRISKGDPSKSPFMQNLVFIFNDPISAVGSKYTREILEKFKRKRRV